MSWSNFAYLISNDNRNVQDWKVAVEANPNTPDAALKIAMMHFISCQDVTAIEEFCSFVVELIKKISVEETAATASGLYNCFVCGEEKCTDENKIYICGECIKEPKTKTDTPFWDHNAEMSGRQEWEDD